jgi:hypothetical protein
VQLTPQEQEEYLALREKMSELGNEPFQHPTPAELFKTQRPDLSHQYERCVVLLLEKSSAMPIFRELNLKAVMLIDGMGGAHYSGLVTVSGPCDNDGNDIMLIDSEPKEKFALEFLVAHPLETSINGSTTAKQVLRDLEHALTKRDFAHFCTWVQEQFEEAEITPPASRIFSAEEFRDNWYLDEYEKLLVGSAESFVEDNIDQLIEEGSACWELP